MFVFLVFFEMCGHREERGETVVGREEEITFIRQSEYASSLVTVQRDL